MVDKSAEIQKYKNARCCALRQVRVCRIMGALCNCSAVVLATIAILNAFDDVPGNEGVFPYLILAGFSGLAGRMAKGLGGDAQLEAKRFQKRIKKLEKHR